MNDDLIKRSDALKVAYRYCPDDDGSCSCADRDLREMLNDMEDIPSADRPQGEWKRRLVDNGFNADWICSECGYRVKTDFVSFNFCPNCGADMRGNSDDVR